MPRRQRNISDLRHILADLKERRVHHIYRNQFGQNPIDRVGLFSLIPGHAGKLWRQVWIAISLLNVVCFLIACQDYVPNQSSAPGSVTWATYTALTARQVTAITVTTTIVPAKSPQPTMTAVPLAISEPATTPVQAGLLTMTPPVATPTTGVMITHTIVAGDTFLNLSIDYDVALDQILAANQTLDPTNLQIGQSVLILLDDILLSESIPEKSTPSSIAIDDYEALENDMLFEVNDLRENAGIHLLMSDVQLREVARGHAIDMARRNFFDHVTPEGVTLRDRLRAAGIDKHWVGENIQANSYPADQAAKEAMHWFVDSEPHLNNILAEPFSRLGVGVAEGQAGWYIFVLVFAGES